MNRRDTLKTIGIGALFGATTGTATATPGQAPQGASSSNNPGRVGDYNGKKTLVPPKLGGFDHVLLYLADGEPLPGWDGVAMAEHFQREIMGRDTGEILAERNEAVEFYWDRFGIDFPAATEATLFDVVDSEGDIDATLRPSMFNSGRGYTAYVISGRGMPNTHGDGTTNTDPDSTGKVRDGSWSVSINEDATLGGTYGAGGPSDVPAGAAVTFGNYNIRMGDNEDPIVIKFLSEHPIVSDPRVPSAFNCDLEHED